MDCRTAHLLIEAFHDDELGVVEAASLLAHLDACPCCARRCEAARRLKQVFRDTRPVISCPDALRKRLARRIEHSRRFPRAVPPSLTLFVVAAGLGFLVGEVMPVRRPSEPAAAVPVAETATTQRVTGEVFCLRCALQRLFPGVSYEGTPHRTVLRTADGRLFTLLPGAANARLVSGCAGRRVDVLARLYPRSGLAQVVSVGPSAAAPAPAAPALTLARN